MLSLLFAMKTQKRGDCSRFGRLQTTESSTSAFATAGANFAAKDLEKLAHFAKLHLPPQFMTENCYLVSHWWCTLRTIFERKGSRQEVDRIR